VKLIFTAVFLVLGAALPRHVAGHFTSKCRVLVLTGANLQAECDNNAGELEFTSINLNNCVAFLDDQLEVRAACLLPRRMRRSGMLIFCDYSVETGKKTDGEIGTL
jgi:hypothetical protein